MRYLKCGCGKCERWGTGETVHPCEGCEDCYSTFADNPLGHQPLQPHDYEPYFLGGSTSREVRKCKRCHNIDKKENTKLKEGE